MFTFVDFTFAFGDCSCGYARCCVDFIFVGLRIAFGLQLHHARLVTFDTRFDYGYAILLIYCVWLRLHLVFVGRIYAFTFGYVVVTLLYVQLICCTRLVARITLRGRALPQLVTAHYVWTVTDCGLQLRLPRVYVTFIYARTRLRYARCTFAFAFADTLHCTFWFRTPCCRVPTRYTRVCCTPFAFG